MLTENSQKFLDRNPEYVGSVMGYKFYEHPIFGDEAPLCCITPEGRLTLNSEFWELPTAEELM